MRVLRELQVELQPCWMGAATSLPPEVPRGSPAVQGGQLALRRELLHRAHALEGCLCHRQPHEPLGSVRRVGHKIAPSPRNEGVFAPLSLRRVAGEDVGAIWDLIDDHTDRLEPKGPGTPQSVAVCGAPGRRWSECAMAG